MSAIFIALLAFSSARRVEETEELLRREEAQSHAQQRALPLPEEPIARTSGRGKRCAFSFAFIELS